MNAQKVTPFFTLFLKGDPFKNAAECTNGSALQENKSRKAILSYMGL